MIVTRPSGRVDLRCRHVALLATAGRATTPVDPPLTTYSIFDRLALPGTSISVAQSLQHGCDVGDAAVAALVVVVAQTHAPCSLHQPQFEHAGEVVLHLVADRALAVDDEGRVDARRRGVAVAEQGLQVAEIDAAPNRVDRERVARGVRAGRPSASPPRGCSSRTCPYRTRPTRPRR